MRGIRKRAPWLDRLQYTADTASAPVESWVAATRNLEPLTTSRRGVARSSAVLSDSPSCEDRGIPNAKFVVRMVDCALLMKRSAYVQQAAHAAAILAYCIFVLIPDSESSGSARQFDRWSSRLLLSLGVLALALLTSIVRAASCQFGAVAALLNIAFLFRVARRYRFRLGLIGTLRPSIDLAVLLQCIGEAACV